MFVQKVIIMKKQLPLLSLFIFVNISFTPAQKKKEVYNDAFKLVEIWLEAQQEYEDIPSIMGVVVNDQEILWSGAFGNSNVEMNTPTTITTSCSICSISKIFTATAIMKLVDEGKLNLDDNVKDILKTYTIRQKYPDAGAVTIASLLSHSSGVPRDTEHSYWSAPDFSFPSRSPTRLNGHVEMLD